MGCAKCGSKTSRVIGEEPLRRHIVSIHSKVWCFDQLASFDSVSTGFIIDAEKGYILTDRHAVLLPCTSAGRTTIDLSPDGNFARAFAAPGTGIGTGGYSAHCTFHNQEQRSIYHVYRDPLHEFNILCFVPQRSRRKAFSDLHPTQISNKDGTLGTCALGELRRLSVLLQDLNRNIISTEEFQAAAIALERKRRGSVGKLGKDLETIQGGSYIDSGAWSEADRDMTRALFALGQLRGGKIDFKDFQKRERMFESSLKISFVKKDAHSSVATATIDGAQGASRSRLKKTSDFKIPYIRFHNRMLCIAPPHPEKVSKSSCNYIRRPWNTLQHERFKQKAILQSRGAREVHPGFETSCRELLLLANQKDILSKMRARSRLKKGLPGFVNGTSVSALADTGARDNFVSAEFAQDLGLSVEGSSIPHRLGNKKFTRSIGTVKLLWAFAESPAQTIELICHVLPRCTYRIIIGKEFLVTTKTISNHMDRLRECLFTYGDNIRVNFLGNELDVLRGQIGGHEVTALPDTGAESNIMDFGYAKKNGFKIDTGPGTRKTVEFADSSIQPTVGQVYSYWTFASGQRVQLAFDVIKDCCSDVILGVDFVWDHKVFEIHEKSMVKNPQGARISDLAPFTFVNLWQQGTSNIAHNVKSRISGRKPKGNIDGPTAEERAERCRRAVWYRQYGFDGAKATEAERDAERLRQEAYNARRIAPSGRPPDPTNHNPTVSSTPTDSLSRHNSRERLDAEVPTNPPG